MKKFLVCALPGKRWGRPYPTQWTFNTAKEVGTFMWGKSLKDYAIYIRTELPENLHDIESLRHVLAHMAIDCTTNL